MAGVRRVKDLVIYQLAVQIRRCVFRLTRREPMSRDFKYVAQIRDAARGGSRNIVEGFARFNPAEFRHFLSFSRASLAETMDALEDGVECGYLTEEEFRELELLIRRSTTGALRLMEYLGSARARDFFTRYTASQRQGPVPDSSREPPSKRGLVRSAEWSKGRFDDP